MKTTTEKTKLCQECGVQFNPNMWCQIYCGVECRKAVTQRKVEESRFRENWTSKVYYFNCSVCGKLTTSGVPYRKYCSDACVSVNNRMKKREYTCVCDVCGLTFTRTKKYVKRCSKECREIASKRLLNIHRECVECKSGFVVRRHNKRKLCHSCSEKKRAEVKRDAPTVSVDLSFRNKGLLETPVNTWYASGFTKALKDKIKQRDGWECYICGKTTNLHVHHIIPRIEGGEHTPDNLVTLCGGCHRSVESGNTENAIEKCIARAMRGVDSIVD